MSIKLLVADDHEVVRHGVASLLEGSEIKIVAEATTGDEAIEMARTHQPQVVLLDIRMPSTDGFKVLEGLLAEIPAAKIVVLSIYDNPTYIARAVALGASDYLLKGCTREELIGAITAAVNGESPSKTGQMHRVAGSMATTHSNGDGASLTNRETQVLRHVALGLRNKEIGRSLAISPETVKDHVQNILRKIDVGDRTQAAVWALRNGLG